MKLIKQPLSLKVVNVDVSENKSHIKHSALLPNSIRCIICGPSNCGKTNVMLSLLIHENGLKFKNIYLYSKTALQPKYRYLHNVVKRVPNVKLFIFNEEKEVISPNDAFSDSVIIFDDIICENQTNIRNYFTMGRHNRIDCFYLAQTYSKIPKQLLRDNANFLIIFKQDDTNLKHIFSEHVNNDLSWFKFKELCSSIWDEPYSFLIINKESSISNGRYRKDFDSFITFAE